MQYHQMVKERNLLFSLKEEQAFSGPRPSARTASNIGEVGEEKEGKGGSSAGSRN
jgi:hypothetical protein